MATPGADYDIVLRDNAGSETIQGLILARDADGRPIYERSPAEQIPAVAMRTGEASFAQFNPEQEIVTQITDWSAGFGQYRHTTGSRRYNYSDGLDPRWVNRINLAPKLNGPLDIFVRNAKFENFTTGLATGWSKHSDVTATQEQAAANITEGTSSQKIVLSDDVGADTQLIWVDLAGTSAILDGRALRIQLSYKGTGNMRGFIYDGSDTQYLAAATSSFASRAVVNNIGSTGTAIRIGIATASGSGSSSGSYCYIDDLTVDVDGEFTPTNFVNFEDNLYMAIGGVICKWNETTDVWDAVYSSEFVVTSMESYGGNLYAALGTANPYVYSANGSSWTISNLSSTAKNAEHFVVARNVLYKTRTPNLVNSSTNPVDGGSWSSAFTVGDSDRDITGIYALGDLIYVGREDGLGGYKRESEAFDGGTDRFLDLFPDFRLQPSANNFKVGFPWHGKLYLTTGRNGLMSYDGRLLSPVTPAMQGPDTKSFGGQVRALGGDTDWLFAIEDAPGATLSNILAGRFEIIDGVNRLRWHTMLQMASGYIKSASADGNYLYLAGTHTNTDHSRTETKVWRWNLPSTHANYAFETGAAFQVFGQGKTISDHARPYVVSSWIDNGFASLDKEMLHIAIESQDLTADGTRQIDVEYQTNEKDDDDSWSAYATFGGDDASPHQIRYAKAAIGTQANRVYKRVRFRLSFYSSDEANNLTVFAFVLTSSLLTKQRDIISFTALLEDRMALHNGAISDQPAHAIMTNLTTLRDNAGFITLQERIGNPNSTTSHDVRIRFTEEYILKEPKGDPQRAVHIEARTVETA